MLLIHLSKNAKDCNSFLLSLGYNNIKDNKNRNRIQIEIIKMRKEGIKNYSTTSELIKEITIVADSEIDITV